MKNKKIIITLSIIAILVLTIGITYSIFTSSKTGKNSNLVVGDIYMHYNETNQIQMENAMPTNIYLVNSIMATQEYTEGGTNELSKCVDAFVNVGPSENEALSLCKGNSLDNGITLQQAYENGILDRMNLTDTFMQENIIIFNPTIPYFEFTVDGKNTTTNKDIWYEVVLSKGDNLDGKTRIKDNLLKFRLTETKDNKETIVVNNKSYSDLTSKRIWVDTINKNTINEVVHTYKLYMWISNDTVIGNVNQDYTMEEWKSIFASIKVGVSGDFNEKELAYEDKYNVTDASCFTTEEIKDYQVNSNMTDEELNKCTTYITNLNFDWNDGETVEAYCKGTGTNQDSTFQNSLDYEWFSVEELTYFESNNIINPIDIYLGITDYNTSCGTDVVIPKVINAKNIQKIGKSSFNNNGLTSVIIPNSVKIIRESAFSNNQLTSVVIPNSVTTIKAYVFEDNQLTSVEFSNPSKLERIEYRAFRNNNISTVSIPETVTYLDCSAFDENVLITKSDSLVCIMPIK